MSAIVLLLHMRFFLQASAQGFVLDKFKIPATAAMRCAKAGESSVEIASLNHLWKEENWTTPYVSICMCIC